MSNDETIDRRSATHIDIAILTELTQVKIGLARLDEQVGVLKSEVNTLKKEIEMLLGLKNRVIGMLIILSAILAVVWNFISEYIKGVISHVK